LFEERDFWAKIDLGDCYKAKDFEEVSFPTLKSTTRAILIRIPAYFLNRIKEIANEMNVCYQSLITIYLKKAFGL
jgi:predicted DNA binding CopG/RHH family protein